MANRNMPRHPTDDYLATLTDNAWRYIEELEIMVLTIGSVSHDVLARWNKMLRCTTTPKPQKVRDERND